MHLLRTNLQSKKLLMTYHAFAGSFINLYLEMWKFYNDLNIYEQLFQTKIL